MEEKVGDVKRTPLGALKKICEENSMMRILGDLLPRFDKIVIRGIKMTKEKGNEQKAMFTASTREAYLGEEVLKDLRQQDDKEIAF
jgi:hypothetical protein